jgi:hypothetical protein
MRWSEPQLADHMGKRGRAKPVAATPQNRMYALGRLKTGEMNKLESSYAAHLEGLKQVGEVLWWKFEGIKLRLADNTFYTADFAVMASDGVMQLHEVKGGFWQDDSRVKIKVAASLYPFEFVGAMPIRKGQGGGWKIERF